MLQALSSAKPPSGLPPMPLGFTPVEDLASAWRGGKLSLSPHAEALPPTVAQLGGLRYERKVKSHFAEKVPGVELGPWFLFRDRYGTRRCQPDMLFPLHGWTVIAEIKANHTTDAWWQLRKLYEPVVAWADGCNTKLLVITENFDPAVPWPEELFIMDSVADVTEWLTKPPRQMGVIPWKL